MNKIDMALSRALLDAAGIESSIEKAEGKPDIVKARLEGFYDEQEIISLDKAIIHARTAILKKSPMKKYRVAWESGREKGAIGIMYPGSVLVTAMDPYDALMQAYRTHDHMLRTTITEVETE